MTRGPGNDLLISDNDAGDPRSNRIFRLSASDASLTPLVGAGVFGYAGDERAYEVDLKAGFRPTGHQHLIAHFHKPVTDERRRHLIEKIHAIGPF